jgi:methionyl-tRNA formyltransferase
VGSFALECGLEVYTPKTLKSAEVEQQIKNIKADIIIVVAYGFIIPKVILDSKKYGCLNIHPSLLPKYRGAAPLQRTIMNGEDETAVCIMQMDEGLDTGDILISKRFPLEKDITLTALHDKCANLGAELLLEALDNIDTLPRIKQESLIKDGRCVIDGKFLSEEVAYAKKLSKTEAEISWGQPALLIDRKIRGANPWPGVYFNIKNMRYTSWASRGRGAIGSESLGQESFTFKEDKIVKILQTEIIGNIDSNINSYCKPGDIISDGFEVVCGDGKVIKLLKVKPAGKPLMSGSEFLRGLNYK